MGHHLDEQAALFYEFSLERHVPPKYLLRSIDRFVELDGLRRELSPFYRIGRSSIAPELMIRMLLAGCCFGIRSERRLCEEAHFNLAYRWFCRLGLDDEVSGHSTFSKNRHDRFRDSDLLRQLFEAGAWLTEKAFAVDASLLNGYLPTGVPMLKRVLALPGHNICGNRSTIWVDGIEMGQAQERDRRGRPSRRVAMSSHKANSCS